MLVDLELIVKMQGLDLRANELRKEIALLPKQIAETEKVLITHTRKLEADRALLGGNLKERKLRELEIQTQQAKAAKLKDQMAAAKTNEQFRAFQNEIDYCDTEIKKSEDRIVELLELSEPLAINVKAAEAALAVEKSGVEKQNAAARERTAVDQKALDVLMAERKALAGGVTKPVLNHFERLSKKYNGLAIADATRGRCTSCNLEIRPQLFQDLRRGERLFTCAARLSHAGDVATLSLAQTVPPTPGQPVKQPVPIPLRVALFDRATGEHHGEQLLVLDNAEAQFSFPGFAARPALSINRDFSAPVVIDSDCSQDDLVFLAAHDDDPFARYEAMQSLVVQHLVAAVSGGMLCDAERQAGRDAIGRVLAAVIDDPELDDLMRGELMILPSEGYLAEQLLVADPGAIHEERESLKAWLGRTLKDRLTGLHERTSAVAYSRDAAARGARKLKTQALVYLAAGMPGDAAKLAAAQYRAADNMTDRQGALMVLAGLGAPEREELLADFHQRYAGNALVIDKWFSLQAGSLHPDALEHVKQLGGHPDFTLQNPNRVRALYMALAANQAAFHAASGEGYRMIADLILALDPLNAQTAARFIPPMGRWRRIEADRSALMRGELERIAAVKGLSRDAREQVTKSLG